MRITVRQLRELIAEQLDQAKLGIAGAFAPAQAYGVKDDEPEEVEDPRYIMTMDPPNFEPDEDTRRRWRDHIQSMAHEEMSEPWPPEESGVRRKAAR